MVTLTTTDFVSMVKNVAHFPQGNNTFSASQILALGDMQMRTLIAPKVSMCRENYWLTTSRQVVNDTNRYEMPSKSLGNGIVTAVVDTNSYLIHLTRLEIGDLYSTQFSPLPGYGYYIEDNILKLNPTTVPGTLVMYYYRIPSKLVPVTSCGQITDIDYEAGEVTVGTVPSSFIGSDIELDVVSQQPGFNVLIKDSIPLSIVGSVISFDLVPLEVRIGDYVCLAGQSCVVQCPLEWVEVLVQAVTVKVYEIQGYLPKMNVAKKVLDEMVVNTTNLVSPRTIENSKVIYAGGSLMTPQTLGWLPVKSSGV